MTRTIRWGVLGAARIATQHVIPAMQQGEFSTIVAIASRDGERARLAAAERGIARWHPSYEALLGDADVDAVYIPLPNNLHLEWSLKALDAGKHVLCEKPIGMNAGEAQALLDASERYPRLKVMEAFMYRLHPQWQRARVLVLDGAIGTLRTIQTFFAFHTTDPHNVRNIAAMGGGALMDIGCYGVSLSRWLFGVEPARVFASMDIDPQFGVDRLTSAMLDFPDGGSGTFTVGTQLARGQGVTLVGDAGQIQLEIPFNPPIDRPTRLWHTRGTDVHEIRFDPCSHFTIQGDLFARAILDGTPVPTPLGDAVANMRVIDALVRSAREGRPVAL